MKANELTNARKRVNRARKFPHNTCPASRHLHLMAEALATGRPYPMLNEEPQHCASTMLAVLESQRLGLRYVDFIIPSSGKAPEDYFDDGFARSPEKLGAQAPAVFHRFDYAKPEEGLMRIQYGRGLAFPDLPPDLEGSVVPPPALVQKYTDGPSAVLDIDHWRTFSTRMKVDELATEFQRLRDDISLAFKSIITKSAEVEWSTKPVLGDEDA